MGLSPKYRAGPRRSGTRAGPPATPSGDTRFRRPIAERTAPVRAPSGALRREASAQAPQTAGLAPFSGGRSAIEEAVSTAYQVFDRYLEEGRQFAQGQSAWYGNAEGQPELTRDAARTFADFLGILGRLARELQSQASALPALSPSTAVYAQPSPHQPGSVTTPVRSAARLPITSMGDDESTGGAGAGAEGVGRGVGSLIAAPSPMNVAPSSSAPKPVPFTPIIPPPAGPAVPPSSPIRRVEPMTVPVSEVKTLAQPSPAGSGLPPRGAAVARVPQTAPLSEWEAVANSLTPPDPRDEPRWPGGVKRPGQ